MEVRKFTDCKGRTWEIEITWTSAQRLKKETGVDIDSLVPKPSESKEISLQAFHDFITDGERLFPVIWALVRPEAERLNITQEDFGGGFNGETFIAAGLTFTAALIDFFPNHLRKSLLAKVREKGQAAQIAAANRLTKELDKIDPEKAVNDHIDEALRKSSGGLLEPQASPIPALTA